MPEMMFSNTETSNWSKFALVTAMSRDVWLPCTLFSLPCTLFQAHCSNHRQGGTLHAQTTNVCKEVQTSGSRYVPSLLCGREPLTDLYETYQTQRN